MVFKEVDGESRVTYALTVEDFIVKPPPNGWGAHDTYVLPFPPSPCVRKKVPYNEDLGRRTPVGRRERSRSRGKQSP